MKWYIRLIMNGSFVFLILWNNEIMCVWWWWCVVKNIIRCRHGLSTFSLFPSAMYVATVSFYAFVCVCLCQFDVARVTHYMMVANLTIEKMFLNRSIWLHFTTISSYFLFHTLWSLTGWHSINFPQNKDSKCDGFKLNFIITAWWYRSFSSLISASKIMYRWTKFTFGVSWFMPLHISVVVVVHCQLFYVVGNKHG